MYKCNNKNIIKIKNWKLQSIMPMKRLTAKEFRKKF